MELYCKVTAYGLVPLYDSDYDDKKRLKVGSTVKCAITKPRNLEHHKKFFALIRLTLDNLPEPLVRKWGVRSEEDMLKRFKRDLGMFTSTINDRGEREIEYESISFASMDQTEFERFYNRCIDLILTQYICGLKREELEEEVERYR
ncbi:MAG: DUF1367 family protein [Prevotella sp.]|nr:DUF1367 family protein [Prevotella sp.]